VNATNARLASRLVTLAVVVALAGVVYVLPAELRLWLLLWTMASVPAGVLIGHCVLPGD
jgi:hypothetical protein